MIFHRRSDHFGKQNTTSFKLVQNYYGEKTYLKQMNKLQDERIVFIFDECHRSQFGDTHKRIVEFFNNHQMFGFTGTPIFAENALSKSGKKHTTKDLFHKKLHSFCSMHQFATFTKSLPLHELIFSSATLIINVVKQGVV